VVAVLGLNLAGRVKFADDSADTARRGSASARWPADTAVQCAGNPPAFRPGVVMTTNLPSAYSRSLLKVRVPVTVTLAAKKQSIGKIIELVPGSIIAFDKSCDEMLELEVSGHPIAEGECVKVGDKFGLRVTSLILPDEQLQSLKALAQKQSSTP
jgi:flagellar motor switch protein FliN/FliY